MVALLGFWILMGLGLALAVSRGTVTGTFAIELSVLWLVGLAALLELARRRGRRTGRSSPRHSRLSVARLPRRSALWVARHSRRRSHGLVRRYRVAEGGAR